MRFSHLWDQIRARNPEHSFNYAKRWAAIEASGNDIYGEARLIDALAERGSRILDAGCGTGRLGGYLAKAGHQVVGIDIDEILIAEAKQAHPESTWVVGDIADSESVEALGTFDIVFSAGNVLTFLDPASRRVTIANLARALRSGGRLVNGFGAGRGYEFSEYDNDVRAAGLEIMGRYASWTLDPFSDSSGFLVSMSRA